MSVILETRGLSVSIAGQGVCGNLDLRIHAGECWAILGQNGSGKTTLLKALAGLHVPDSGEIRLADRAIHSMTRREVARLVGVLFQEHRDLFPATVLETTLIGRHPYLSTWQWEDEEDFALARQALRQVGLGALEARDVATLSGGERQRLEIATVLTQDPSLLLLDEPTNHLDLHHQIEILDLIGHTNGSNGSGAAEKAVIMVLHDVNLAARFCDHALLLFGTGECAHGPVGTMLTVSLLERLYGHPLRALRDGATEVFVPA